MVTLNNSSRSQCKNTLAKSENFHAREKFMSLVLSKQQPLKKIDHDHLTFAI